ncbi:MAG: YihY/virulence factor BrkB family protein, partial [Bacteroidetes bacterium]|nr:YihY/virulence factor BrkB family protein [Bacteroidota bacterium]
ASAITFNLFLCAIPFTLILLSILGYVLSIDAAFNEILRFGRELFPSFSFETAEGDVISASLTIE